MWYGLAHVANFWLWLTSSHLEKYPPRILSGRHAHTASVFLSKREVISEYLQGYGNLISKMRKPSIPVHTVP